MVKDGQRWSKMSKDGTRCAERADRGLGAAPGYLREDDPKLPWASPGWQGDGQEMVKKMSKYNATGHLLSDRFLNKGYRCATRSRAGAEFIYAHHCRWG